MRDYAKKARTDAPTGLSHWDKSGRDSRSGYGKKANADMQPMQSKGTRLYPKGNSERGFEKKATPFERVQRFESGGYADRGYEGPADNGPTAGMSDSMAADMTGGATNNYGADNYGANYGGGGYGQSYDSPTAGMPDGMVSDMVGGATNNYGADNYGASYGGGGYGASTGQEVPGYNYSGIPDAGGWTGGGSGEPGYSGSAGETLSQAVDPVRAAMDAPLPTSDAYGRAYSPIDYQGFSQQPKTAPESVIGPQPSLANPVPSYNYAQGKYGYAITTPNVPQDQTVLDGLVDIAVEKGLNPESFVRVGFRESSFKANAKNGKYEGMYQLSPEKAKEHGINRSDWRANANAAATDMSKWSQGFQDKYGRQPTAGETYLSHQQGETGFSRLASNPDKNAIEARGNRSAIVGNVDSANKSDAANWTSQQFIDYWNGNLK